MGNVLPVRTDMPVRMLGVTGAVVGAGLLTLIIHTGDPSSSSWWLAAVPFAIWIIGPAIVPYLRARRLRSTRVSIAMLAFLVISTALSAIAYYEAMFVSASSTAALIFLFVPLYQRTALLVVAGVIFALAALVKRR